MNPAKVIGTVNVYGDNDEVAAIETLLEKPGVMEEIEKGTEIIFAETNLDLGKKSHELFTGVDFLLELLKKDSEKPVICLSTFPVEAVRAQNYKFDFLGDYPNTLFFSIFPLAEDRDNLEETARYIREDRAKRSVIFPEEKRIEALARFGKHEISHLVHDLKADDPKNPQGREIEIVEKVLAEARNSFPSLQNLSDNKVIDFIYAANSQREEVMKGKKISGVYCDIEGTLLVDGSLNEELLEKLKEYPQNEVTLWTDGNQMKLRHTLRELGVNKYPVKRKSDFAGATAEIVIDDLDEKTFTARTKIRAKKFIQVEN